MKMWTVEFAVGQNVTINNVFAEDYNSAIKEAKKMFYEDKDEYLDTHDIQIQETTFACTK